MDTDSHGGSLLNLVVLFLSDVGQKLRWADASLNEISAEAEDRETEILHFGKKSPDVVLRLPEGTKTWEARVGFENAWMSATGEAPSFVARSARSVSLSYLKGGEISGSLSLPRKDRSAGIVFMETRGVERLMEEECERLLKSLGEIATADILLKRPIEQGEVFVVKAGRESEEPSFSRVARVVQECYRSVLGKPIPVAGRGMGALKSLQSVIEKHAPRMVADTGLMHEVRKEPVNRGLA